MYFNRKKYIIKNIIFISIIIAIALFATYKIYYKFTDERNIDYSSESLEITFHETTADKIAITKANPVPDSIGLSSTAYTLTITNNLTIPVSYQLKLIDDVDSIVEDTCEDKQISKELIRVSIKGDKDKNKIFTLSELEKGILTDSEIEALGVKNYSIRIWVTNTTNTAIPADLHYHGKIQVVEDGKSLAIR